MKRLRIKTVSYNALYNFKTSLYILEKDIQNLLYTMLFDM